MAPSLEPEPGLHGKGSSASMFGGVQGVEAVQGSRKFLRAGVEVRLSVTEEWGPMKRKVNLF